MKKYVREDGKVAVLISSGYGSGWSTWNNSDICFDYEVVQWVLDDKPNAEEFMKKTEDRLKLWTGGMNNLEVVWLKPGTCFRISEYDGYESIVFEHEFTWFTA